MSAVELSKAAFELFAEERLELARWLAESVIAPKSLDDAIAGGVQRIENIVTGKVKGLAEGGFRAALP